MTKLQLVEKLVIIPHNNKINWIRTLADLEKILSDAGHAYLLGQHVYTSTPLQPLNRYKGTVLSTLDLTNYTA